MDIPVLIIGGGLAGLVAARRLHQAGIAFRLLEARDRLGGRIFTAGDAGTPSPDGFDLGPSWFWPGMQPAIGDLVRELGLPAFAQCSEGDVVFQRMSRETPHRYRGMPQEPQSMRVAGGTASVITALVEALPAGSIQLEARVTQIEAMPSGTKVTNTDAKGVARTLTTERVIFALPPRLLEATMTFAPPLDAATAQRWRDTPTWMAPHAKFFALYDQPFWVDAGLSGTAQSMVGPLAEIHDATTASGSPALFGFIGIPAAQRALLGHDAIVAASLKQLGQLFGTQAEFPRATLLKDWAADPLTATPDDSQASGHPIASSMPWVGGAWAERILLAGSETSASEPGYLAGAVEAGARAARTIISARASGAGDAA